MEKEKTIGIKSYIQVVCICAVTLLGVLYLANWYSNYKKDKLSVPVIDGVLSEIKYEELDPYLSENNGTLYLYMCTSDEEVCRNFETKFIKYIKKKNLYDKIVYLNLTDIDSKKEFIKRFNDKYAKKSKISAYPTMIYFENNKIKTVIGGSNGLTIAELEKYLNANEII